MAKERLDVRVTALGLAESRERARADIMSGLVYVDGAVLEEPYIREATHLQEGTVFPLTVPPPSISYFFASILFPFYAANFAARLL